MKYIYCLTKKNIDNMCYESMLSLWRLSPTGHLYFQSDIGEYFNKVMSEKQSQLEDGEHTRISKAIGW